MAPTMAANDPPAITSEEVLRIGSLAHLDLGPEEIARMTRELGDILGYVKQLEEVDVSAIPPTAHVQIERLALRPDEPAGSLPRDLALREAPKISHDGFAVPAFVDEG
jgi:aspartyl-tRNA(Asn)/glutamyl-tRNA(Gln) amidotransferase subunit C